jgi:transposase
VYEAFKVDSKRYYSWKKQLEETGSFESGPAKERDRKINKSELLSLLKEHPDWYLRRGIFFEVRILWRKSFVRSQVA